MIRQMFTAGKGRSRVAALLLVLLWPALATAGSVTITNDSGAAVIVQAVTVVRGAVVRDRPYLIAKGDKSPSITLPGNKVVTVYDARVANRILFQGVVTDSADDLYFGIVPDGIAGKMKLEPRKAPTPPKMP